MMHGTTNIKNLHLYKVFQSFKELSRHNREGVNKLKKKKHKNVNGRINTLVIANITTAKVTKEMGIQFRMQMPVLKKQKNKLYRALL